MSGSEWVASQRAQYHALFSRYVKVRHRGVLKALEAGKLALASAAAGGYRLAVHKRVATPAVFKAQAAQSLPPTETYIEAAREALRKGGGEGAIWLASDDEEAVAAFSAAFGDRCVVRSDVKRTRGPQASLLPALTPS